MRRSVADMTGHVQNPSLAAEEQEVMDGPAIKQTTCYPTQVWSAVRHCSKRCRGGEPGGCK